MPFNSGIFTLIPSYKAIAGATIKTENHNQPLEDIANGLSSVVTRDGTSSMVASLNMGGFKVINLAPGLSSTDAATVGQIQSASPIGIVSDFAGATAPAGWLLCYGQAISRTTYAALFAVIGTTYGAGDGSTTFNVPDCRDVAIVGRGNMGGTARGLLSKFASATLGALFGVQEHTLTVAQMPAHPHTFTGNALPGHSHQVGASYIGSGTSSDGGYITATGTGATTTSVSAGTPSGTISSAGGDGAHPNVQPSLVMSKIIRATY